MMNDIEMDEEDEDKAQAFLDDILGAAIRSVNDAAYLTALKTARSLLKSTNAEVALKALTDMIAVFDPPREEEEEDEPEPEAKPFSLPEPPLGTA